MENLFFNFGQMFGVNDFWGMIGVFAILIIVILID